MKKIIISIGMILPVLAYGETWVGMAATASKYDHQCALNNSCSESKLGYALKWDSVLSKDYQFLGDVYESVEVGGARLGKVRASGRVSEQYFDPAETRPRVSPIKTRIIAAGSELSANYLFAALKLNARFLGDGFVAAKVGLAYATTTLKQYRNDANYGGITENHIVPLLGIELGYVIVDGFRVSAGYERMKAKVDGESYSVGVAVLGAQVTF